MLEQNIFLVHFCSFVFCSFEFRHKDCIIHPKLPASFIHDLFDGGRAFEQTELIVEVFKINFHLKVLIFSVKIVIKFKSADFLETHDFPCFTILSFRVNTI